VFLHVRDIHASGPFPPIISHSVPLHSPFLIWLGRTQHANLSVADILSIQRAWASRCACGTLFDCVCVTMPACGRVGVHVEHFLTACVSLCLHVSWSSDFGNTASSIYPLIIYHLFIIAALWAERRMLLRHRESRHWHCFGVNATQ
jgi:hypothetical protein